MNVETDRVRDIFLAALKVPRIQREAYLGEACGGDQELRNQVERLLQAHEELGSIAERTGEPSRPTVDEPAAERPGTVIGHYKLLEPIGEGGMGTVWMAQQTEPVKRLVALKLIKPGMDTKQVIARFEAERQALALMDHPNIAKVLDGGTSNAGRPYFVMELVKGEPITKYCDERCLTPRQRLELFIPICQAVQHAHQKGIIHRDLKPSNVLVALYDGKPVPKVIDFGVAKAIGQPLTEQTLVTGFGAIVGTLEYMSPEQAEINQLDIDTRSDIYSLGVLLYELLTGTTPLEHKRVKESGLIEALRIIREEEVPTLSKRLSSTAELPAIAANRGTEPAKLTRLVRGELDWIVMKALEKDRNRRYETANALALDVQRYLADEPVQACPPSVGYRLRKFARRHKAALAGAAIVLGFVALLGGGIGWVVGDRAARSAATARKMTTTLEDGWQLLADGNWPAAQTRLERAVGLSASGASTAELDEQLAQLRKDLQMVRDLEEIRQKTGDVLFNPADFPEIDREYVQTFQAYGINVQNLEPAIAAKIIARSPIRIQLVAALDEWAIVSLRGKGDGKPLIAVARQADPDERRNRLRDFLEQPAEKRKASLLESAASVKVADLPAATVSLLGEALAMHGCANEAVDLLKQAQRRYPNDFWVNLALAYSLGQSQPPRWHEAAACARAALALRPGSALVHNFLGFIHARNREYEQAFVCFEDALKLKHDYAPAHLNLGALYTRKRQCDQAIASIHKALHYGNDWPEASVALGLVYYEKGQLDQAMEAYKKAIRLNPGKAEAYSNLGLILAAKGELEQAIKAHEKAVKLKPELAEAWSNLCNALRKKGRYEEAIAAGKKAIELEPESAEAYQNLGIAYTDSGQPDQAIASLMKALRRDANDPAILTSLGRAYSEKNLPDQAITFYKKAISVREDHALAWLGLGIALAQKKQSQEAFRCFKKAVELDGNNADTYYNFGLALKEDGQLDDAITKYREAIRLKKDHASAHLCLANVLMTKGKLDDAIASYEQAILWEPRLANAHLGLAIVYRRLNDPDKAIACCLKAIRWGPELPEAHLHLGVLWMDKKQPDRAIPCFQKAIALNCPTAHNNLGVAFQQKDMLKEAIASYRNAVRWHPNDARYKQNLAAALNERAWRLVTAAKVASEEAAEAVELAREAVALDTKYVEIWNTLGVAHYRDGNSKKAIAALQKSVELTQGGLGEDFFFLAMAHSSLGNEGEARMWYDKAVRWMATNQAILEKQPQRAEELRRWHAEAAALLKVSKEQD